MNNSEHKWIEDRLQPQGTPEPPEGLLDSIQEEIPRHLRAVPHPADRAPGSWRLRLLAASLFLVVLSGTVAYYQVASKPPALNGYLAETPTADERAVREAPEPAAGSPSLLDSSKALEEVAREIPAPASVAETDVDSVSSVVREKKLVRKEAGPTEGGEPTPRDLPTPFSTDISVPDQRMAGARVESEEARNVPQGLMIQADPVHDASSKGEREPKRDAQLRALGYSTGDKRSVPDPAPPASTGGTAEPNDEPYGDMFFRAYGTNPFFDTEDDALSTFGLDVDTGSFTLARNYLDRGHLPPPEAIRVEEFVNYFDYQDPAPRRGEFTLIAEGAPSPFADGPRYQLVRFGIKAKEIHSDRRPPASLIFVVDVSGSMRRENRIQLVKRSLHILLDQLTSEDRIGLVVYGSRGEVLLEPTRSKEAIRRAVDRLQPGGSTNAEEGLELAYDLARRSYREGDINRIILCSDGVANVGRTGPQSILRRIRREADEGIELTTVGFGMGNYNDVLMEQLADQGDGSYAYVDTLSEARRIFVENLSGTLQTIASDAKVQVEFNPKTVSRYRLLGYENRDIADDRFRDDTVDAGEVGVGHTVTALYEIKLHEGVGKRQRLATLRLRYRSKATDEIVETAIDLSRKNLANHWYGANVSLQLSALAAEFAEILKGSYWAKDSDLDELYRRLRPVADRLAGDEEVEDLLYLVDQARRLSDQVPGRFEE